MQSRFYGADGNASDAGDFLERKFLDEVQQQHGALRWRQLIQQTHKLGLLFLANKQIVRRGFELNRCIGEFVAQHFLASPLAPALDAFLVRNAEEPAPEFCVLAQAADVAHGIDEAFLHEIEARLLVANQFKKKNKQQKQKTTKKRVPG